MSSISGESPFKQSTLPPITSKISSTVRPSTAGIPPQTQTGQLLRPSTAATNKVSPLTLPSLTPNKSVFSTSKHEAIAEKADETVKRKSLPSTSQTSTIREGASKKNVSNMNKKVLQGPLPKIAGKASTASSSITQMGSASEKVNTLVKKLDIKTGPPKEEASEEYADDFLPLDENSTEYSDDFASLEDHPASTPIPSSSNLTHVDDTSLKPNDQPVHSIVITKNGDIDHTSDSQHLASSLREELHIHSLALPFKSNENPLSESFSASLDQSFINHLVKLPRQERPFKPESGQNGITRLMTDIVIKADDLDGLKRQANLGKILDHYKMKTPDTHLLGKPALGALSSSLHDFTERLESQSNEPAGALVMAKVKGITFGEVISEGVASKKNPSDKQSTTTFDTFCRQIDHRMQELGNLAVLDMLTGNTDRLVKTGYSSENPEHQLRDAIANVGNWMYMTDEGSGVKSPSHLGTIVPIDNSCFDYPYTGEEDTEKNKKSQVDSFISLMKQPQRIAQHIIDGLDYSLSEEYHLNLKENPEAVFGEGVTLERLAVNLEMGLKLGMETIKSSKNDHAFFSELINAPNTSEQDQVIYATILSRAESLKSL